MTKGQLAKLLKTLRKRLCLSQAKLARTLKVSFPTINRWENEKTFPDALALHAIEQFVLSQGNECADIIADFFPKAEPSSEIALSPRRVITLSEEPEKDISSEGSLLPRGARAILDVKTMEGILWQAACSI